MSVDISNKTRSRINQQLVCLLLEKLLAHYRLSGQLVSVVFIGDRAMTKLNADLRGKNKPTDILSFASRDAAEADPLYLGELIVDWAQIKRQAPRYRQTIKKELVYIITHGFLHLLGYDDQTEQEAQKMKLLGEKLISRLKLYQL